MATLPADVQAKLEALRAKQASRAAATEEGTTKDVGPAIELPKEAPITAPTDEGMKKEAIIAAAEPEAPTLTPLQELEFEMADVAEQREQEEKSRRREHLENLYLLFEIGTRHKVSTIRLKRIIEDLEKKENEL